MLPPEVWQLVSDYLTTREFLVVSSLNRANRAYLCLRKAVRPKLLDASRSPNKPHPLFRNLHTLIAAGSYKITCFPSTLTSLDISYNKHIRVIDLPKLTRLRACGIPLTEELFTGLNLEELIIPSCDSIPLAVQRMTSLKQLDISKTCCDQFTLRNLHLTHLIAFNCPRLTDLSFMTSLTQLDISWRCGVGDRSLHTLVNLTKLDVSHNPQVINLHHLTKLTNLSARFCYLQSLPPNLTKLDLSHCQTRLQLNQLHRLRDLRIEGRECLIDQGSIDGLRLTKLNITDNPRIYHLESLLTLSLIHI